MAESQSPSGPEARPGPGGFFPQSLPSPAPSRLSTNSGAGLPHPRASAIRAGSALEDKTRRFVESRLLTINRRYVKKFGIPEPGDEVVGYVSMAELCRDLEGVVKMIWLSGTPSLQIPYLLNIANEFTAWLNSFPPSPAATFSVLRKLDHCFASLLAGQDIETKEGLPGFVNGLRSGMSRTDMVRCKSLVVQTRVLIVEVMSRPRVEKGGEVDEERSRAAGYVTETETETDGGDVSMDDGSTASTVDPGGNEDNYDDYDDEDEEVHMDVARVYENTVVQLGVALGDGGTVGEI